MTLKKSSLLFFAFSLISAFAADIPDPLKPQLKTIEIEWEAIEKAGGYEVRLMPKAGGKPLKFFTTDSRLVQAVPVGEYRMQVRSRAKDEDYFSPWSDSIPVQVVAKEITPLKPADQEVLKATGVQKYTVEFEWKPVDGVKDYTLKVWNEERVAKPWVFVTRNSKKKLDVPPGEVYHWQVLFESNNAVSYAQAPTTFSFTILGQKLTPPEIQPAEIEGLGRKLSWHESPGAAKYQVKLYYRHLDEEEWHLVSAADITDTAWSLEKMKRGIYKVEVQATAPRRQPSDVAKHEFYVKPQDAEIKAAFAAFQPADSIRQPAQQNGRDHAGESDSGIRR